MTAPHIVGWGHTPFGRHDATDLVQLIRDAALPAIASAGLTPADIDGVFIGHFNGGFLRQDFSGALAALASKAMPAVSPSLNTLLRDEGRTARSRPSGCRSRITWASATAAWPSTAAW